MAQLWPLLLILAGLLLAVSGGVLVSRSLNRLQRAGALSALYWASFRHYRGYRLRSLRPAGGALLGVMLVGGGLASVYLGLTGFYAARLGGVGG